MKAEIQLKEEKGITLIALVITIILLLILAGITIVTLTGENGILKQSGNAKEENEKAKEKEIVALSVTAARTKENYDRLEKSDLEKQLELNAGEGKTELYDDGDGWVVYFTDSRRVYSVDNNNSIKEENIEILIKDSEPGKFDGSGTKNDPYVIMSIEDLMYLSQTGNNGTTYSGKYIKMGKTLNFKSELSYADSETKDYNEFLGISDDIGLLKALTKEEYAGFKPISNFQGNFNGNNKVLKNLYVNNNGKAGLFSTMKVGTYNGTVENLEITGKIICNGDNAGAISAYRREGKKLRSESRYIFYR